MTEIWRSVPGWEGLYEVSDQGRVRSLDRIVEHVGDGRRRKFKGRVLRAGDDGHGYVQVSLTRPGERRWCVKVYRLVLLAFRGAPGPGQEGSHLNGRRSDDRLANLVWEDHRQNCERTLDHGTDTRGERNAQAKLTQRQVRAIRSSREQGVVLAARYGVAESTISNVRNGLTYAPQT